MNNQPLESTSKTNKKKILIWITIAIASIWLWYITIPAVLIWWLVKTQRVPKKVKLLAGIIVGGTFLVLLFAAGTSQQSETSSPEPITIPEQTQEQREAQQKTEEEVQPRAPVEKQQEEAESQEPEVAEEVPANETYEYKLALINKGGYVREDDTTVNRFRFLLNRIESNTQNTRQEISDMTVKAWQILQSDYGKTVTLLQVMEEANDAVGPETKGMNYADIMSMLIVLMGQ